MPRLPHQEDGRGGDTILLSFRDLPTRMSTPFFVLANERTNDPPPSSRRSTSLLPLLHVVLQGGCMLTMIEMCTYLLFSEDPRLTFYY